MNPIGAEKFISSNRRAVNIFLRQSKKLYGYTLL